MTKKQKKLLWQIFAAAALFGIGYLVPETGPWKLIIYLAAYLTVGLEIVIRAFKGIAHGQVFDENFLMTLATVGAFLLGDYPEGVAVMLFYQVGELFQSYAVGRSRQSISSLMDLRPDYANVEEDGKLTQVDPDDVEIGQIIVVKPGERVPLDGTVISGKALLDTAALTGESVPREIVEGQDIMSGCIDTNGVLRVKVTTEADESTVAKILELVENAASKKSNSEQFITRFARWYTPCVTIGAVLLAFIPPFFDGMWQQWISRALTFLVISCPCALVISVPLGFFGGIGAASKLGVLVKGSNYLEQLCKIKTAVFDKTGTLTKGVFNVTDISPVSGISSDELLNVTALAESFSDHPISVSLKNAWGKDLDNSVVSDYETLTGKGVRAVIGEHTVHAGNARLMETLGTKFSPAAGIGTVVYVDIDGKYAGSITISDEIKPTAKEALAELKAQGVEQTVMLTGDTRKVGEAVGAEIGIGKVYAELLPGMKVDKVEELIKNKPEGSQLAFVGDGINDAPVLMRADIGIAMGGVGSDAAIEAADVVIMDDNPERISTAMRVSAKTRKIVTENIWFALGIKALFLILGALGIATMWDAVFADVGVSIIAILNSMRMLSIKEFINKPDSSQNKIIRDTEPAE
ncbi:MAG: heavy metal translocating P-type ATPase [Eubacteriaceae bacterium]|jgi:Cd2+/Zn2+-exporting ATPase